VPVISAIGHEIDFTIADLVADLRAPTPSAAAELVVSQKSDIIERLDNLERRLKHVLEFRFSLARGKILELSADRVFLSVENRLASLRQRVDELGFRVDACVEHQIGEVKGCCKLLMSQLSRLDPLQTIGSKRQALAGIAARLDAQLRHLLQSSRGHLVALNSALCALSPHAVLERGYAICKDSEGRILRHAGLLQVGDPFSVQLYSGGIAGRVEQVEPSISTHANEPDIKAI
jgi:exodeoxyribonuclease VII large subunit